MIGKIKMSYTNKEMALYIKKFKFLTFKNRTEINYLLNSSIAPHLIITIYIVEQMNRGHILLQAGEYLVAKICPIIVEYFDWSLGPYQMKPSFYKRYCAFNFRVTDLINFKNSSNCLEKFLQKNYHLTEKEIISYYHSGKVADLSHSTRIYNELYEWFKANYKL